jgi:hypothetical protein
LNHPVLGDGDPTDSHVSQRGESVSNIGDDADQIDHPEQEEDEKWAEHVEVGGILVLIQSLPYLPPNGWAFRVFPTPNPWTYVDIHNKPPDALQKRVVAPISLNDKADRVRIEGQFDNVSVPPWPLRCEGNLATSGGSGHSTPPVAHWAAKIQKPPILQVFIGQSDEINDEANFYIRLTDYPADGERPRNPRYIFGKRSPIFIQVSNYKQGLGILEDRVLAMSRDGQWGQWIDVALKEVEPGVYRNVKDDWNDCLYLGEESAISPQRTIKVVDEDVLTFILKEPDGIDPETVAEVEVMVDRAECGAAYYTYGWGTTGWRALKRTKDNAENFLSELQSESQRPVFWQTYTGLGNGNCKLSQFAQGTDATQADAADIVIWNGHGDITSDYYCAFLKPGSLYGYTTDPLFHSGVGLGDTDTEWVIFNTCRFLNTNVETADGVNDPPVPAAQIDPLLKQMFQHGLHLACGFKTKMRMHPDISKKFIEEVRLGHTIVDAWLVACALGQKHDGGVTIGRVFGAKACINETFYTEHLLDPIVVQRDPLPTDEYGVLGEIVIPPYNP